MLFASFNSCLVFANIYIFSVIRKKSVKKSLVKVDLIETFKQLDFRRYLECWAFMFKLFFDKY